MAQCISSVKWFNNVKGYGFLGHEGGPDVFCHYSSIQLEGGKTLKEGAPIFDMIQDEKGLQADHVVRRLDMGLPLISHTTGKDSE